MHEKLAVFVQNELDIDLGQTFQSVIDAGM